MSAPHTYTEYHPKWYRRRTSTYWWMRDWRYLKFILRELSCLAVAWFVVEMLMLLWCLSAGEGSYAEFQALMRRPLMIALNAVAFVLALYHTITWFNLAPRAMPVRLGGKRLPDWMVAAPNYGAWIAASAVISWFLLRS
jgi:fumarate reductase subunit C